MTADLAAFLRAALDEVERVAGAAAAVGAEPRIEGADGKGWEATGGQHGKLKFTVGYGAPFYVNDDGHLPDEVAAHIVLHDPRAALARVQAERRLLKAYESGDLDHLVLADVLRWLAHGHRHTVPGYDPAWAPEGVSADA